MKIGVLSDTHENSMNALEHIIFNEFVPRGVDLIIHCGDIEPGNLDPKQFANIPVILALTDEQVKACKAGEEWAQVFKKPPPNWWFTRPDDRVLDLTKMVKNFADHRWFIYVGHKRSFDFLTGSGDAFRNFLHKLRLKYNNLRLAFSGHTHHGILMESPLVSFINSGAVEDSFGAAGGYEFVVIEIIKGRKHEIVFSRLLATEPTKTPLKVGVLSDSYDVGEIDPLFWGRLAKRFREEKVTDIIHIGNMSVNDIGIKELAIFTNYYNLRPDQDAPKNPPKNWQPIYSEKPLDINGYRFAVQLELGPELLKQSEVAMQQRCNELLLKYPESRYLLCGGTSRAFLEEAPELILLNPGGAKHQKDFAMIDLPRNEITFSNILDEPFEILNKDVN